MAYSFLPPGEHRPECQRLVRSYLQWRCRSHRR